MIRSRFLPALWTLASLTAATVASAAEYVLDAGHSNVQFSVPLMAVSKVTGKFMRYDVKLVAGKARDLS